jgi:hypothetical protein
VLASETEAELAGLLSHAMGHIQSGQSYSSGQIEDVPLVFVGGPWGFCLRSGTVLIPAGAQNEFAEEQADMLALGYLAAAGYDPRGLVTVYQRRPGKAGPTEAVAERADALGKTRPELVLTTRDFEQAKARLTPPQPKRPSLN